MTNTIAIVGGGISGTLTVLKLIKQSKSPLHIIWFDAKNQFCKGLAYSTSAEQHLLNVHANNMSIFVEDSNHFMNWLTHHYNSHDIKSMNGGFEIHFSDSKIGQQSFKTDFIFNCTGSESDYLKIPSILVQNLLKNKIFTPDSIHYGINATKNGEISPDLYTLGPPLKGILWESTAVPEIRHQAKELATKIICN